MSANTGWLFYKDYFKGIDYTNLDNPNNESIINKKVQNIISQNPTLEEQPTLGNTHFKATTTYPGLILGSGNAHELPSIKGQAILGFHFDYTSGLPIIQGSSIKGVLRSAFKHQEYIAELISSHLELDSESIKQLEEQIFNNKDIFFDATITAKGTTLLGDDYITPHKEELKNPIPLRFIKVMPNVTFKFDFELSDFIVDKKVILSSDDKAILFAQIIADLGLGAKTNVGYGGFNQDLAQKTKLQLQSNADDKLKEKELKDAQEKQLQEEEMLNSVDSNLDKIKIQIKEFTNKDTKDIYDIIVEYELSADEKGELTKHLVSQIGEKPAPKNKAPIKWAIKVYEMLAT